MIKVLSFAISLSILFLVCSLSCKPQPKTAPVFKKIDYAVQSIFFIDSTTSFNTIEDILTLPVFQKKIVYIDLWATTCAPCIREFSQEKLLQEKYKNKSVEFLYVCYNYHDMLNDSWRKKWKDLVYKYRLKGTHIYAYIQPPDKIVHQKIDLDFLSKCGAKPVVYGVPTYMIAKNGKIINYNAYRPSDRNKLYEQINLTMTSSCVMH